MPENRSSDVETRRALEIELETRMSVADFDMDKMIDVVEVMWRNREKITETVDNVWDHWDDIMATVDVVLRNRDAFLGVLDWAQRHSARLVDLADALPELLHKTGDGIEAAGHSARQAGGLLAGSKEDDAISASELMDVAAKALEQCHAELDKAAGLLALLGEEIDDIRIPRFAPRFVDVMGVRVVNGVDVGESSLIDTASKRLKGGAERLAQVGEDLENVAGKMRHLGGQLSEAGTDLGKVGDQLAGSGDLLRSLSKLDLAPAPVDDAMEITVEIPARAYTAGATRRGPQIDVDSETQAPPRKTDTPTKNPSAKNPSAKKTPAKQASTKKSSPKKTSTKGSSSKGSTAKGSSAKSSSAKNSKRASGGRGATKNEGK